MIHTNHESLKHLKGHDKFFYDKAVIDYFYNKMDIYLKKNKLGVPICSMLELLVCEAHSSGLMGHFSTK